MKWEIFIGIIGIVAVVVLVGVFVSDYHRQQNAVNSIGAVNVLQTNTSTSNTPQTNSGATVSLDTATVAQHNTASDCWIIVDGKVYAVTNYLRAHPGGSAIIVPYCGRDATTAYATKGGQGSHSGVAAQELAALLLGPLNSSTTSQAINQTTATVPSVTGGSRYYEREDD